MDHAHSPNTAGMTVLFGSVIAEAVAPNGLTPWTQFFAAAGFLLTLFTSLPRVVESYKLLARGYARVMARYRRPR